METRKQQVRHQDKMARRRLPAAPETLTFELSYKDAVTLAVHSTQQIEDLGERVRRMENDKRNARRRGEPWHPDGVMNDMFLCARKHLRDTIAVLRAVCSQYEVATGKKVR